MSDNNVPDFEKIAQNLLKDLPKKVGDYAKDFFIGSFEKEGFTNTAFTSWIKRKDTTLPHPILSLSGALKRSIRLKKATHNEIVVSAGEGLPYASIHNEGGFITITPRMRKFFWAMFYKTNEPKYKAMALTKRQKIRIEKRQFIGNSYILEKELEDMILKYMEKEIKNYAKTLKK